MSKELTCKNISPLLMGYIKDRLCEQEIEQVDKHLTICPSCQDILKTLAIISNAYERPQSDLSPALRSRLAALQEDEIYFRLPPLTWQVALSFAIIVLTLLVVPDSWRILAAIGLI